jgi:hypothetical protein
VCVALASPSAASAAAPPDVSTGAATGVDAVSATLNGTVDPHLGQVVDCHFEIAPPTKYGDTAPCWQQVGSGDGPIAVTAPMIDLGPAVTYTYHLVVVTTAGRAEGAPVNFTTVTIPPDAPEVGPKDVTWTGPIRVRAGGVLRFGMHNHLAIVLGIDSVVARVKAPAKKKAAAKKPATARAFAAKAKTPAPVAQMLSPTLRASHTTQVTAKMTRKAFKQLQKKGKLRVTVTVTLAAPDGLRFKFTKTTTLRRPKKKH